MDETSSPSRRRGPWWRVMWILPAAVFVALLGVGLSDGGALSQGDEAPDFSGESLDGGTVSLAELRGKPVLINFWASWCGPCEDEAPMLRRAFERYGDRVSFIGVNIRDAHTDALDFLRRYRLDYEHVRDSSLEIYEDYGLTGQPESFFIDRDGRIFEHVPGPFLSETDLFSLLDRLTRADG